MTIVAPSPTAACLRSGATLFVDGAWNTGETTYERLDPADLSRVTGTFAAATAAQVGDAYDAAATAQPRWAALPMTERAAVLRKAADLLEERVEAATERLTADMGKARRDARGEVLRSAAILRYFAGELLQPSGETYPSADPGTMLLTLEEPVGLVCAITPWNFPFAIPTWKLAPAIAFGNAVVWKPAEAASGSAVFLTNVLADAGLPAGVLNLVTGKGRELSSALTGDPRLSALTFTGSGSVGVRLRQAVADRNVKVQLELGGKNPAIVLADADLDDAAGQIVRGAMLCTGQRCTATSRVYVEQACADEFRRLLVQHVDALVVGDPYSQTTDVGPLASAEQRETVAGYLTVARDEGAEVVAGGTIDDGDGCYVAPTVLARVDRDSTLVRDEIFGPVLVLEEVADFEAALDAANDTEFGLASSLFTRDFARTMSFVHGTRSGLVHVNRETAGVEPHVPFGGIKGSSSMAREQGKAARQFFSVTKTVYLRTPAPAP